MYLSTDIHQKSDEHVLFCFDLFFISVYSNFTCSLLSCGTVFHSVSWNTIDLNINQSCFKYIYARHIEVMTELSSLRWRTNFNCWTLPSYVIVCVLVQWQCLRHPVFSCWLVVKGFTQTRRFTCLQFLSYLVFKVIYGINRDALNSVLFALPVFMD